MVRQAMAAVAVIAVGWPAVAAAQPAPSCRHTEAAILTVGEAALANGVPGLVIGLRQGQDPAVVHAFGLADLEAGTPMTPESVFRIASLTKQLTAALVLQLSRDGLIDLDQPATTYLPDQPWLGSITVYQLLVQTSGLPDYAGAVADAGAEALPRTPDDMLTLIDGLDGPTFAPGEAWAYSNSNYAVLGAIVERITGASYGEALRDRLLDRIGLAGITMDDPRDVIAGRVRGYSREPTTRTLINAGWIHPSLPGPAGGLRADAADLLAWSDALHGGAGLGPDLTAALTAPGRLTDGRTTRLGMPQAWQDGLNADYAMGLFVSDSPIGRRLWHGGDMPGFVTWLAVYPDIDTSVVILQNADFADLDIARLETALRHDQLCRNDGSAGSR